MTPTSSDHLSDPLGLVLTVGVAVFMGVGYLRMFRLSTVGPGSWASSALGDDLGGGGEDEPSSGSTGDPAPDPAGELRRRQGAAMRRRVEQLGWSRSMFQRHLAAVGIHVRVQAITQWVNGQTAPKQYYQLLIAEVLGMSVEDLFTDPPPA